MGRELPTYRSATALMLLVIGSFAYVETDQEFHMAECLLLGDALLRVHRRANDAGEGHPARQERQHLGSCAVQQRPSVFSNAVLLPRLGGRPSVDQGASRPSPRASASSRLIGNHAIQQTDNQTGMILLFVSCLTGTLIGYCGWWCRSLMSATAYTVVGVSNKFITIAVNRLLWPSSTGLGGLLAVVFCVFASSMYRQAPLRNK
eukprot:scaffold7359_cov255-Pinguiococcus_pyrenoidosus.AAC.5